MVTYPDLKLVRVAVRDDQQPRVDTINQVFDSLIEMFKLPAGQGGVSPQDLHRKQWRKLLDGAHEVLAGQMPSLPSPSVNEAVREYQLLYVYGDAFISGVFAAGQIGQLDPLGAIRRGQHVSMEMLFGQINRCRFAHLMALYMERPTVTITEHAS